MRINGPIGLIGVVIITLSFFMGYTIDSVTPSIFALTLMGILGCVLLIRTLTQPGIYWSISGFQAGALMFWYGLGSAYALSSSEGIALMHFYGLEPSAIAIAGLLVSLCAWMLWLVSPLEAKLWRPIFKDLNAKRHLPASTAAIFTFALSFAVYYLISNGFISLRQVTNQENRGLTLMVLGLYLPTIGALGWIIGGPGSLLRPHKLFTLVALMPVMGIVLVSLGRLPMALYIGCFFLFLGLRRGWRFTPKQIIASAMIAIPLLLIGSQLFHAIRLDFRVDQGGSGTPILEAIQSATDLYENRWDLVLDDQVNTLPSRIFFIGFPALLVDPPIDAEASGGTHILAQFIQTIPSILINEKNEIIANLGGVAEERIHLYGLPRLSDFPNSVVTATYMDFGWATPLVVAFTVPAIGAIYAIMIGWIRDPTFRVMGLTVCVVLFVPMENIFYTSSLNGFRQIIPLIILSLLAALTMPGNRQSARLPTTTDPPIKRPEQPQPPGGLKPLKSA